ncbi:MAG: DUF4350 domain-containing protein [Candidatus Lokiarchaeota archaeon]|nr:DUF4350 domain-containing protein [Candidatus Harpocratesius repetitus]
MNYGIILTPFGLIIIGLGILAASLGAPPSIFGPMFALGIFLLFGGLARLVQGKNRKILGQIIRPKAAARSSIVWALLFFNITPFIFINTEGLQYIFGAIPFPITVLMSSAEVIQRYFAWMPAVFVTFHIIWFISFFLSGKIPKIINIIMNFVITLCFSFWMSFGSQFLLWTFSADKSGIVFMEPWQSATTLEELITPLIIGGFIVIFSLLFLMRMLKNLQTSFSNLNRKGGRILVSYIFLILCYIISIIPLILAIYAAIQSYSLIVQYTNYISIVFLSIGIFRVVTTLINTGKEMGKKLTASGTAESKSRISFGITTAIYVLVFILAWAPIFMPIVDRGQNNKSNSIYNPDWNGWSSFKTTLESRGYEVRAVQSSISTVSQLDSNKQIILVVAGPNIFYNPASEIPFLLSAFQTNFSMMICDDHGTAGTLLTESFVASMASTRNPDSATPLTFFPNGVLIDNASYWNKANPEFPVIQDFSAHEITTGINKVVLDHATGFLGGEFLSGFGWNFLGQTSGHYSFIDVDGDHKYDQSKDIYPFPSSVANLLSGQSGTLGLMGTFLQQGIPLGGYAQAVFSSKEVAYHSSTINGNGTFSSRIFVATDASWLNNQMVSIPEFDNLQMGIQTIEWLACDRAPSDTIVVFDEAHIAPDSPKWNVGRTQLSSAATFGAVQAYLNWMSTNPILALVYPIFALQTFRKWIPKEGNKKKLQLQDLEAYERDRMRLRFRTSSFFAQKINWYRQKKRYRKAILELFRRVERKVNRLLGESGDRSLDALMRALRREHGQYISKDVYNRIEKFFEKMFKIKAGKENVRDEREFELLFMEMSWVANKL